MFFFINFKIILAAVMAVVAVILVGGKINDKRELICKLFKIYLALFLFFLVFFNFFMAFCNWSLIFLRFNKIFCVYVLRFLINWAYFFF